MLFCESTSGHLSEHAFCHVQTSPEIKAWMAKAGLGSVFDLEAYFEQRVLALAKAAGRSYIVWQVPPG